MSSFARRQLGLLSFPAFALSGKLARAAALNPAAVTFMPPDQIKWSPPSQAGAQSAVLVGDAAKEGLYVQMVKWLAGNHFSHPHFYRTIASSSCSRGPGGSAPASGSIPRLPCRCRQAAS